MSLAHSASAPAVSSAASQRSGRPPTVPSLPLHNGTAGPGGADVMRVSTRRSGSARPSTAASTGSSIMSVGTTARDRMRATREAARRARKGSTGRSNLSNIGELFGQSQKPSLAMLQAQKRAKEDARRKASRHDDGMSTGRSTHSWVTTGRTGATEKMRHPDRNPAEVRMPWMTPRDHPMGKTATGTDRYLTRTQLLRARKAAAGVPSGTEAERMAQRSSGTFFNNTIGGDKGAEYSGANPPPIGLGYVEKPRYRTRSEMLEHKRKQMLPPLAYDFDGDGVVDSFELFLGKRIDTNGDGRIDTAERKAARHLLDNLHDIFVFGLEASGANVDVPKNIEAVGDSDKAGPVITADEAVHPPWATSARRGLHDSARSRWSDYGTAYKIPLVEQRARDVRARGPSEVHTPSVDGRGPSPSGSAARPPSVQRPRTGMSALIGV